MPSGFVSFLLFLPFKFHLETNILFRTHSTSFMWPLKSSLSLFPSEGVHGTADHSDVVRLIKSESSCNWSRVSSAQAIIACNMQRNQSHSLSYSEHLLNVVVVYCRCTTWLFGLKVSDKKISAKNLTCLKIFKNSQVLDWITLNSDTLSYVVSWRYYTMLMWVFLIGTCSIMKKRVTCFFTVKFLPARFTIPIKYWNISF